jgi:hypothetical protein
VSICPDCIVLASEILASAEEGGTLEGDFEPDI